MSANPLVDQVMGRFPSTLAEDDVVPVPCTVTRRSFRDRMVQQRQRPKPEGQEDEPKDAEESMAADLRAVLGEADENDIIPQGAKEIDPTDHIITARMNPIKDVVQEPSHPSGEKEKYLTPYAALTAPDATPEGMTPIDPSKVPGAASSAGQFTWGDLQKAPPEPSTEPAPAVDIATQAMDVLLGRNRAGSPAKDGREFARAGAAATEAMESAVTAQIKTQTALTANPDPSGESLMPEHKAADPKKLYEAVRKYM